jgi:plastocyanin
VKNRPFPVMVCSWILIGFFLMAGHIVANDKKGKSSFCSNPHPEQLCSAANTCGSSSSPCLLEVKRTGGGSEASVTPNIPGFPKDSPICIKSGTTVTWQGAGKNTGFMVDFAASSPFDPSGTISGGSDRPITVTARKAGCFKYSLGACTPGTIYGMCGNSNFELIVTGGQ